MILSEIVNKSVIETLAHNHSFDNEYDIIVVGLGTAGAIAAITAAKMGLKVLGIERLNCMGGVGTAGGVLAYYYGSKGGFYEEIDKQVLELERDSYTPQVTVNGELKKYVMEQKALEAGVELCYEATVTGVYLEGVTVKGIRWIDADGVHTAGSRIVIDSSGDAEVCTMAGCPTRKGRESDGQSQPFSNVIVALEKQRVTFVYTDSGYVDQADEKDLTRAIVDSALLHTHLKDRYDDQQRFLRLAPLLGIREGRFIEGESNLTFDGYLHNRLTDQPLFYAYANLDNHSKDVAFESETQQDWTVAGSMWGVNFSVPVPLGALIPKGMKGLIVAGRCLALDHDLAPCVRMKRDMQKCGEAAAMAAYLATRHQTDLLNVPYDELAALLRSTGCLNPHNHVGMKDRIAYEDEKNPIIHWLNETVNIQKGLSSEKPGLAIWSAIKNGPSMKPLLLEWLHQQENEHLRKHSSFALALMQDEAALPVLRAMVVERDSFVPKTSIKYNNARGYTAIYLLGKLKDTVIVPELIALLSDPSGIRNINGHTEFIADDEELYFQYFSFSLMALFKIGDAHAHLRKEIAAAIRKRVEQQPISLSISFKQTRSDFSPIRFSMEHKIRRISSRFLRKWDDIQAHKIAD
ncbi:FAD-dependent oxidoreductase [Paenibacillus sp. LMG 31461]|uniref:FAD-dependent oxidoreductase n=1 Tax=Paenibacillus plantarum TaxID=2654975 RepID=A0ABX1XGD7_9BACL|nr:FAD-dependent oxidoreductase [Paenibacillus plantarum]NOU67359.1 FAD-dependent oxidoreductase [Paenibacillus plantarum]